MNFRGTLVRRVARLLYRRCVNSINMHVLRDMMISDRRNRMWGDWFKREIRLWLNFRKQRSWSQQRFLTVISLNNSIPFISRNFATSFLYLLIVTFGPWMQDRSLFINRKYFEVIWFIFSLIYDRRDSLYVFIFLVK